MLETGEKMTDEELTALIKKISLKVFHRPFNHRANFNARLKTTGGRYHLLDHHIDINPKILTEYGRQTLIGVIKHELCHYHLHLLGLGYQHKNQAFKQLLRQTGGLRYAPGAPSKKAVCKYLYQCQYCGQVYPRVRRVDITRYVCSKCHGPLTLVKKIN